MRKLTAVISLVLLVAPLAIGYAATEKRVHKVVPLNGGGSLSISTHNGSITVKSWTQPSVDIDARIETGEWGTAEDVDKTQVQITGSGSSVRVESDYSAVTWRHFFFTGMHELPPIRYTISMPATARLDIDDHNASVHVSGLRNDLRINSHNGSIEISDFDGGANVETHNGDVRVAYSRFAKSSSFETHNGAIEVQMPGQTRFHINAHGHHLGVNSEFPIVTSSMGGSRYVGDVNGGGPELRLVTHKGTFRLIQG